MQCSRECLVQLCYKNLYLFKYLFNNDIIQTKSQRKSPFFKLRELKCIFTSPVHLVMLKYLLHFAHNMTTFSLELLCQPLEDSFINSLVNWGSWNVLDTFLIHKSPNLSLITANTILGSCAKVKKIGSLSSWGHVDRDQLKDFKQEIKRRNFDIVVEQLNKVHNNA